VVMKLVDLMASNKVSLAEGLFVLLVTAAGSASGMFSPDPPPEVMPPDLFQRMAAAALLIVRLRTSKPTPGCSCEFCRFLQGASDQRNSHGWKN
jgi:hypothetical protein